MPILPLFLLACTQSSLDTGTGDSGGVEHAAPPDLPLCEGADYDFDAWREPYPTNPWWYVRTSESDVLTQRAEIERTSQSVGCPAEVEDGERETFSGDCAEAGVSFAGEWIHEGIVDELTAMSVVTDTGALSGDGRFSWELNEDHTRYAVEADGWYERGMVGTWDGLFTFEDLRFESTPASLTGAGRVAVDWAYGRGAYCLTAEVVASEACPGQAEGYWAIQGLQSFTFVPTGCDGCIDVYRDGAWDRTECDLEDGLL